MPFNYNRTVRLSDTDAAGVVYFAQVLVMCHEAYEESLLTAGIDLNKLVRDTNIAIPIVHSCADYFHPILWGDKLFIQLQTQQLRENEFEINYQIVSSSSDNLLAKATTRHVCIATIGRKRISIPAGIIQWLMLYSNPI